jgi:hypothetical protein
MKRHTIAGQFSSYDRPSISSSDDSQVTFINFFKTNKKLLEHGIGKALKDLISLGIFPSEIGVDLLILAAHVFAADTRISRKTESQDTWTREIQLIVPVSDPDRWSSATNILVQMLNFLTGDRWMLSFRPRPRGFNRIVPTKPKRGITTPFDGIALFSGGLDSLIGAIDSLENGQTPLFVSHAGEGAVSLSQDTCFNMLEGNCPNTPINRLRVWMNFPKGLVHGMDSESTTRGRSFLFFAIGAFAGTGLDKEFVLRAPENGLIAINVPLDPMRLGALSTRTMHPYYLSRWNDLLNKIGIDGMVENPYWKSTKGEMIINCANVPLLQQLIQYSLSCSSPTKGRWHGYGIEHCGYCLPCLVRRAALVKAFGDDGDPTSYTLADLNSRTLDTDQSEGRQVRSLQFTIERLRGNPNLAKLLIHKPGPLSGQSHENMAALADVFQRGMDEVATLLAQVRT